MITNNKPTSPGLLEYLRVQQVNHKPDEIDRFLNGYQQSPSPSLLIQILSALGVIIASNLIILTLFAARILNEKASLSFFICGGLALALAFMLSKASDKKAETHPLTQQITLAAIAVGKLLLCAGVVIAAGMKSDSVLWIVAAAMAALTALTYFTFNSNLDRFFSSLLTMLITYSAIFQGKSPLIEPYIKFAALYLPLLAAGIYLLLNGAVKAKWQPLAFALLIFTCIIVPLSHNVNFGLKELNHLTEGTIKTGLAIGFLTVAFFIAKQEKWLRPDFIVITLALTAILTLWGPHNILAALIILIIGYFKFNLPLLALGIVSFGYFLIAYYYQLNISLLEKSGLLAVSGAGLLAVWAYLHFVTNSSIEEDKEQTP